MTQTSHPTIALGVNIDHVATLRQARYREAPDSENAEPSPIEAARIAERAGADGITAHLRMDRRHIQDTDIFALKATVRTKLNLELGNTPEILQIVLSVKPEDVCLVPESREEVSTEGGLDVAGQLEALKPTVATLQEAGIRVSLFVDPDDRQIAASAALGVEFVELHTGAFANAVGAEKDRELKRLIDGSAQAHAMGIAVNAGHGLNTKNVRAMLELPHLVELNIGHSIISRAVSVGLEAAVREMKTLLCR
ncbi:MAG: pyridoxine 5'-phosphate synthase [Terrimicrobiaceae bacterium]